MDRPYFISYSAVEARPFAQQLCTDLEAGAPPFRAWFDRRDLRPGDDWDRQVADARRLTLTTLFADLAKLLPPDAARPASMRFPARSTRPGPWPASSPCVGAK